MALDNTILAFNTYAATDEAIELSDEAFVAQAYASLLGLEGAFVNSEARIAFWVEKLEAGLYNGEELTRDNFAAAFLAAAASATGDEPTLTADDAAYNVAVTTYLSENDATITDLASVAAAIEASGATPPEEPVDPEANPLTVALDNLADARDAVSAQEADMADALVAAGDNTDINEVDANAADAVVEADLGDALDATAQTLVGDWGVDAASGAAFNAQTEAQQTADIDAVASSLQADITAAEADLAAAADALETGVADLVATANANATALTAALDASDAAVASADVSVTAAEAVSTGGTNLAYTYLDGVITATSDDQNADGDEVLDLTTVTNGVVELVDGVVLNATTGNYEFTLTDGDAGSADDVDVTIGQEYLDALVAKVQAELDATAAVTSAQDALASAINDVYNAQDTDGYDDDGDAETANVDYDLSYADLTPDGDAADVIAVDGNTITITYAGDTADDNADAAVGALTALDDYGTEVGILAAAETDLSDFEADVAAWQAVGAIVDAYDAMTAELSDLNDAADAALAAIENATDADPAGLGIDVLEGNVDFDAGDDVYLYADLDGGTDTIANFGADGQDSIYFGEGYTLVAMAEGEAMSDSLGDAATLEIFWKDTGAGLVLYVEEETFAGTGSGTQDITTITLTGVTSEDITFADGYMTAGTAVA